MSDKPEMELVKDWRQFVASADRNQIAAICKVSISTVRRWGLPNGPDPSDEAILKLAKMRIDGLEEALRNAFPAAFEIEEPEVLDIPTSYVFEIVGMRANSAEYVVAYTIQNYIYQCIASQLDPHRDGFLALFVECAVPEAEKTVTQLLAKQGFGTNADLWSIQQLKQDASLSLNSLCGSSLKAGAPAFYPQNDAPEIAEHFLNHERIASAGAFPVTLWGQRIAGLLFVASVHPNFFTQPKRGLLRKYANMFALGLHETQFYPFNRSQLEN